MTDNAQKMKELYEKASIKTEILHQGARTSSILSIIDFGNGHIKKYQSLSHHGAVAIVAQDEKFIYFVKQYRHTVRKIVLELPAGLIELNETQDQAAIRELEEEIGKKPNHLKYIQSVLTSPGILHEEIHLYYAHGLIDSKKLGDDTHEIDIIKIPIEETLSDHFISQLLDAKTIIGLNWLKNHVKKNH